MLNLILSSNAELFLMIHNDQNKKGIWKRYNITPKIEDQEDGLFFKPQLYLKNSLNSQLYLNNMG